MCIAGEWNIRPQTDMTAMCYTPLKEMQMGRRLGFLALPCTAWSIIKVKIIGHIQQNQHHLLSPSLADKHRNSATCRAKWWLAQVEEEKVWKYACKNIRRCNDAIKFSIKYILQSTEVPQIAPKHAWNSSRVLPDCTLFHVYTVLVVLDSKSSQHYKCTCVNK